MIYLNFSISIIQLKGAIVKENEVAAAILFLVPHKSSLVED